ncbi:MAG TPA: DUF167 domain-containing protein, partial [Anaerolineales bacterium]
MKERKYRLHEGKTGSAIAVRVTPRAGRDRITEVLDDGTIKIQLKAAPVDGEANEQLIGFLAKTLRVARSSIEIIAGTTGRNKLISIIGMDAATVHDRIVAQL